MIREAVYAFGCEGIEPILLSAFMPQQISVSFVPRSDLHQTIGAIVGVPGCLRTESGGEKESIGEPMLLFCGFSDDRLELALASMRRIGLKLPHKATLTKSNERWTPLRLFDELSAEHKALHPQH